VVTRDELGNTYCTIGLQELCKYYTTPFGVDDIGFININLKDLDTDYYMFIGDRAADSSVYDGLSPEQTGVCTCYERYVGNMSLDTMIIFTAAHTNEHEHVPDRLNLDPAEEHRALTAKTAIHEIGHMLRIGERDDRGEEIYSGSGDDYTPEPVTNPVTDEALLQWSVMTSGTTNAQYTPLTDDYIAFSIEELLTLKRK